MNYTDVYEIEVEVSFETEVPVPVVTIEPTFIDINKLISGEIATVTMNITNHGLIRADDVTTHIPSIPCFTVNSNVDSYPGSLDAKTFFVFSLIFTRNISCIQGQLSKRSAGSALACFAYYFNVGFSYLCREPVSSSASSTIGSKTGPPPGLCDGGGSAGGGTWIWTSGPGSGGGPSGPYSSGTTYGTSSKISCRTCINAILTCAAAASGFGGLNLIRNCIPTSAAAVGAIAVGGIDVTCLLPPPVQCALALYDCYKESKTGLSSRSFDDISENAEQYANAFLAFQINEDIILEVYGYNLTHLNETLNMTKFDHAFLAAIDGDSSIGKLINGEEVNEIMEDCKDCNKVVILSILERWNTTMKKWKDNILEPTENSNMISFARFNRLVHH